MKKLLSAAALAGAFLLLLALPEVAADGVRAALALCGQVILPSLFPFFVCSNLFLLLGFSQRLSARFGRAAARFLHLPAAAGSAFIIGLCGGYPAGAHAVGLLYERGELSRQDAETALCVCNQAGPSFIFGVLGGAIFKSPTAAAFLYGIQILSAILVCRLTGNVPEPVYTAFSSSSPQAESFAAAFSESVRRAGMSAIQICMFVTVFSVFSQYFLLFFGRFLPQDFLPLVLGSLELSAGCAALRLCSLPLVFKLCLASALLAFGGISVLAQSRAAASDSGLSGRSLLPLKALQAAIAAALTLLSACILHAERWCVPTAAPGVSAETAASACLLFCTCLLLLFRKIYHSFSRQKCV